MSSTLKSCAAYEAYLKMERLPKGVDAFVVRGDEVDLTMGEVFCRYNVSPDPENPVLCGKKVGDRGALRNHIKKHGIGTRNVGKGGAPSIKKQEEAMAFYSAIMTIHDQNVLGTASEYDPSSPGRSAAAQPPQPSTPAPPPQPSTPAPPSRPSRAAAPQSTAPIQEKIMPIRYKSGPRKGDYNFPRMVTLLKDLGVEVPCAECSDSTSNTCLFQGCLNWSYFLDDESDTETPATPAPKKASKKSLKKSSSKATKKKAKESSGGPAEDAEAVDE